MSSSSAADASAAASSTTPSNAIFQSSRTSKLIPEGARYKKQLRAVVAAFAEQFAHSLSSRLITYCRLSKTKTVTVETLEDVAEELLGRGAGVLPDGFDGSRLPQTIIYSRFKANLINEKNEKLRTDSKCPAMAAVIGAHFLHYVRGLVDRVYAKVEDPRTVTVEQVIASLERPGKYAPSGLPCIAYRHNDAIFGATQEQAVEVAQQTAAAADASAAAPAPAKRASKKKAEAAAPAVAPEAVPAPAAKGKKRARAAGAAEGAAEEGAAAAAPAAAPKRGSKKAAAVEETPAEAPAASKKRARAAGGKKAAAAVEAQ